MPTPSGHTTPLWPATAQVPSYPPLAGDLEADVCIVGAGIAGLTVAYRLVREGRRVVVLDDNAVGGGETGRTTAHLASAFDDRFHELERVHGARGARLTYESHAAAIDEIEHVVRTEGIDCDFARVDGFLFPAGGDGREELERERDAAHRAGFRGVELLDRSPLDAWSGPCLRFPNQGQFHPLRYLAGLAEAVTRGGGRIHTGSHVSAIDAKGDRPTATTDDGRTVRAGALVVATNSPINDWVALHTKQAPYRTFVVALRLPPGAVPRALYWDTPDPYHYVRTARDGDAEVLVVGGEDHKTGQADDAEDRFARLEQWARDHFPAAGAVAYRWSGQVMEPVDHLGFIGRDPGGQRNVYVATGDSGQGMTHGTIAGLVLPDLIAGRPNAWETLYDPSRKSLRLPSVTEFAKENLNVAAQYRDYVTPAEVDSADDIPPGTGALLRDGARKIAAFRAEDGTVVKRSAVCTHLWCIVHWNDAERSWDCPCHGSRFAPTGEVLNGPAAAPLEEVD